jgi:hypothetical protein
VLGLPVLALVAHAAADVPKARDSRHGPAVGIETIDAIDRIHPLAPDGQGADGKGRAEGPEPIDPIDRCVAEAR